MPTISQFFGITIAVVDIETLAVRRGKLPRRAEGLVLEWAAQRHDDLLEDWRLAQRHQPLQPIDPLE